MLTHTRQTRRPQPPDHPLTHSQPRTGPVPYSLPFVTGYRAAHAAVAAPFVNLLIFYRRRLPRTDSAGLPHALRPRCGAAGSGYIPPGDVASMIANLSTHGIPVHGVVIVMRRCGWRRPPVL